MLEINTTIDIAAAPERVWHILTDFAAYPAWNPSMRVSGVPRAGERLQFVTLKPSGERGLSFRPTVLAAEPGRELRWLGHLIMPGLFDGEHAFLIEPLGPDRVRLTQREHFTGFLVPLFARMRLYADTRRNFIATNEALKARAEASSR